MKLVGQRRNHDSSVVLTTEEYNLLDAMSKANTPRVSVEEWAAEGFREETYTPLLAAIWYLHREVINRDEWIRRVLRP